MCKGFQQNGTISIDGIATPLKYEYDILKHNENLRSIQKFSTFAKELMYDCPDDLKGSTGECPTRPHATYKKFYDYYGDFEYANEWVLAAFEARDTIFTRGNGQFHRLDEIARAGTYCHLSFCLILDWR